MSLHRTLTTLAVSAVAALALPAAAGAIPGPFGHPCTPKDGAAHCPTAELADRVPALDGVPLDVDVWLPASFDGKSALPTIAMLHGYGGDKGGYQNNADSYSAQAYARAGYAVVVPSARGFGRSCGTAASRTAGCEKGWIHLADARYEVRDVQHLLGLLVDEGIADPKALAATGVSYGGGTSLQLAYLKDRVRKADGSLAPWTSPGGTPLSLAVAWPRWPWSDLADALVPNGQTFNAPGLYGYAKPAGVPIRSYIDGLYLLGKSVGFVAPLGADPGADLQAWNDATLRGEPWNAAALANLREIHDFHGAGGIAISPSQKPAPTLIQNGWTDFLFPAWQGVRPYEQILKAGGATALQLGDLGHAPGKNFAVDNAAFVAQADAWFAYYLKGTGAAPKSGEITAYGANCAKGATAGIGPWRAATLDGLAAGAFRASGAGGKVTSAGGDAKLAGKLNPLTVSLCTGVPVKRAAGTVQVRRATRSGFTLIGPGTVSVRYRASRADAQLVLRLWDRDRKAGTARLVDRSATRLPGRSGTLRMALNGSAWKFAKGHEAVVEILGRDAPAFQAPKQKFTVTLGRVAVKLPTREARPA